MYLVGLGGHPTVFTANKCQKQNMLRPYNIFCSRRTGRQASLQVRTTCEPDVKHLCKFANIRQTGRLHLCKSKAFMNRASSTYASSKSPIDRTSAPIQVCGYCQTGRLHLCKSMPSMDRTSAPLQV